MPEERKNLVRRAQVEVDPRNKVGAKLWAYGYADLAELFGVSEQTVRQWCYTDDGLVEGKEGKAGGKVPRPARKQKLNPASLAEVVLLAVRLRPPRW
jgi:hypothetical protein